MTNEQFTKKSFNKERRLAFHDPRLTLTRKPNENKVNGKTEVSVILWLNMIGVCKCICLNTSQYFNN